MDLRKRAGKTWERPQAKSFGQNWSVESEVMDFLYGLVRSIKPVSCLEIGTFEGNSAIAIASALHNNGSGKLRTVDIKDFGQKNNIKDSDLEVEVFISNDYMFALPEDTYDFVFIDDGHSYSECKRDLEYVRTRMQNCGYVVLHDYITFPGVQQAVDEFVTANNYSKIVIESAEGVALLRKND